jgi:hypothetical protein
MGVACLCPGWVRGYAGSVAVVVSIMVHQSTTTVVLEEEKHEITVVNKFLLLAMLIEWDPWMAAEEKLFTPRVTSMTTSGSERGRLLYEMPLMYRVQVGLQ